MVQNKIIPMSDNWWIEENRAYFCGIRINAIFCVDLNTQQCELLAWIPEGSICDFRGYPYCIKYGDIIFCLPGDGECIWCYCMKKRVWKKIEIHHEAQFVLCNKALLRNDNNIVYLLEHDTGRLLGVNLDMGVVERDYCIPMSSGSELGEYVDVEDKVYCVADQVIQCIDLNSGETTIYEEPAFAKGLFTICYDGLNFWLSGYCKEIYIWNPQRGIIKIIKEFPAQFGFYHFNSNEDPFIDYQSMDKVGVPFFAESLILGKYIWFIPSQSNSLIYIERESYKVGLVELKDEQETKESLQREFACKYLFQYIRNERYIGLYSVKNHRIFEIDAIAMQEKERDYKLCDEIIISIAKANGYYYKQKKFHESIVGHSILFKDILKNRTEKREGISGNIGSSIYHLLE